MFDLPAHLSNLNSIQSPPDQSINAETEDAFWDFMHTDQLFENFGGVSPAAHDAKESRSLQSHGLLGGGAITTPASTPVAAPTLAAAYQASPLPLPIPQQGGNNGPTLEAFLAAFANDHASSSTDYRLPITLPLPYSAEPTPNGVDTTHILNDTETQERPGGSKKLKQMGAPPAEIEEDKRRRNTEASARFRQKKKERESALEIRAKELEAQVAKLAADKSSLENENKLLKAIVLGSGQGGAEQLQGALAAMSQKRKREL